MEADHDDGVLWIVSIEDDGADRFLGRRRDADWTRDKVSAEELRTRIDGFVRTISRTLPEDEVGEGLRLKTVSVTAEVSAKGSVSLLGTGGEVGGKGGVTFTFERTD